MKKEELKLTFELVPKTAWFSNLHKRMNDSQWQKLSKKVRTDANGICKICGREVGVRWLNAHETWEYRDGKQILKEINALCEKCHHVKHFGYYGNVRGEYDELFEWFKSVNNINEDEADRFEEEFFDEYDKRSEIEWDTVIVNDIINSIIGEDIKLKDDFDGKEHIIIVQSFDDIPNTTPSSNKSDTNTKTSVFKKLFGKLKTKGEK